MTFIYVLYKSLTVCELLSYQLWLWIVKQATI